jgi:hypothetical protein
VLLASQPAYPSGTAERSAQLHINTSIGLMLGLTAAVLLVVGLIAMAISGSNAPEARSPRPGPVSTSPASAPPGLWSIVESDYRRLPVGARVGLSSLARSAIIVQVDGSPEIGYAVSATTVTMESGRLVISGDGRRLGLAPLTGQDLDEVRTALLG